MQRLVDSGRITAEEAAVHPRRSVLMRVLGDVDAAPEIDTAIHEVQAGDRWLLCSDGLSSYVAEEKIASILGTVRTAQGAADRLVKESLDHGAPDNVTVVIVDIDDSHGTSGGGPTFVGSAAAPLTFESDTSRRPIRLPTLLLHPLKASQPEDSHFEPEREGYLEELIEEDRRRARRRRIVWLVVVAAAVAAIVGGPVRRVPVDPVALLRRRRRRQGRDLPGRAAEHRADRAVERVPDDDHRGQLACRRSSRRASRRRSTPTTCATRSTS